jgi:hypothetical protein
MQNKGEYVLKYSLSDKIMAYSYAVENTGNQPLKFELNCGRSLGMLYSTPHPSLTKIIRPKVTEFFFHSMQKPGS